MQCAPASLAAACACTVLPQLIGRVCVKYPLLRCLNACGMPFKRMV